MTLAERAARDRAAITSREVDRVEVTLTDPDTAQTTTVRGDVVRTDMQVDPETGARLYEPRATVVYSSFEYPVSIAEGWAVSATDGAGNAVTGTVVSIERNQTFASVRFHIEVDE